MRHGWEVYCVRGFMELGKIGVSLGLDKNCGVAQEMVHMRQGGNGLKQKDLFWMSSVLPVLRRRCCARSAD
jgi:hypothetical protein